MVAQNQDLLPLVGVALVVLAGAAFAYTRSSSSAPKVTEQVPFVVPAVEAEKIDVSIPYDAAARLAYRELKGLDESSKYDENEFVKFKQVYEDTTIANVIVKKKERELREMQAAAAKKSKELAALL